MKNYEVSEKVDVWEAENIFYLKSSPSRIAKLISHYELYKKILCLPGEIIECGVYKGASLLRFATFRMLLENNYSRKIYGFDAFGTFPNEGLESPLDKKFAAEYDDGGGIGISKENLEDLIRQKGFSNIQLNKGNVLQTLPVFEKENPNLRVALLHLDMDVFDPTSKALEIFSKYMVKGGIIIIDDYATVEGATRAVDQFIKGTELQVKKLSTNYIPSYIEYD